MVQIGRLSKKHHSPISRFEEADWTPPLYNIWSFKKNTNAATHFGNSAQEIVDRLLYMYTEPFDIVVDPFGGGGPTPASRELRTTNVIPPNVS